MPQLPYAENYRVMRYGYVHSNSSKKCINSLKIVNLKNINLKVLSILYSLQCTTIIRLGTM